MFGTPESTGVLEKKEKLPWSMPLDEVGGSFFKDPNLVELSLNEGKLLPEVEERHQELTRHFRGRVHQILGWLDTSGVNRHEWSHMRRVANGVQALGQLFENYHDPHEVEAAVQGTAVHDVGYDTHGRDPHELSKAGGHYDDHPIIGANMLQKALDERELRPQWWEEDQERFDAIAMDSILYHSNGSDYARYWDNREGEVTWSDVLRMYARFIDKIDNTEKRVYPRHMEELGEALGIPRAIIRTQMKANKDILDALPQEVGKRVRAVSTRERFLLKSGDRDSQEVFERLREVDDRFTHRLVPYAITGQHLIYSPKSHKLGVVYDVDVDRVGSVLGIQYTPDHHFEHFREAYGYGSMPRAADVTRRIQSLFEEREVESQEKTFSVFLNYGNSGIREAEFCAHVD